MEGLLTHEEELCLKQFLSHSMREQRRLAVAGTLLRASCTQFVSRAILYDRRERTDEFEE